jgi:hypothetical protein
MLENWFSIWRESSWLSVSSKTTGAGGP